MKKLLWPLLVVIGLVATYVVILPFREAQGQGYPNPVWPQQMGSGGFVTNQVSVTTSATQIVAARIGYYSIGRWFVTIAVPSSCAGGVYIGGSGVTSATGFLLGAGQGFSISNQAAVYGIVASTTCTVSYWESY